MKELVEYLVKSLVDNVDAVQVTEVEGEQTTVVEVRVAQEDIGKIIGRQGRTAKALRTIVSAASNKLKKRAMLEILE
ncbi:MAG: KH domain-containing protein [Dissulfuribacterales bacterium]